MRAFRCLLLMCLVGLLVSCGGSPGETPLGTTSAAPTATGSSALPSATRIASLTPTNTSRPTATADLSGPQLLPIPNLTPNPDPVLGGAQAFANRILAAIGNRRLDYQDDFSAETNKWWVQDGIGRVRVEKGYLRLYADRSPTVVTVSREELGGLKDFVLQVDAWPDTPGWSGIKINWRYSGRSWYSLDIAVDNPPWNTWYNFDSGRQSEMLSDGRDRTIERGKPTRILLVVYGEEYALYFNGHPASYVRNNLAVKPGAILLGAAADPGQNSAIVGYDNLSLWDLDSLPSSVLAGPAASSTAAAVATPTMGLNPPWSALPEPVVPDLIGSTYTPYIPTTMNCSCLRTRELVWCGPTSPGIR